MENNQIAYLYVPMTEYGRERRQFIMDWFNKYPSGRYLVNSKYRPQLKNDRDLKKLIEKGFLKSIRIHTHRSHAHTYLVKA